jgi:transposase-like protein
MESHEAGFPPSLEIPSGFPHSHGLDDWIYVFSCPLNSNHRHRKGLVTDVSGPPRNACPGTLTQRLQFLSGYQKEEMSVSDLCREFGVSRPTGYRWINRYKEVGPEGLLDLSSKPHSCSHATPERTENAILALRSKYRPGERGSSRHGWSS